jgi:peroxiredoxin Q/BCP
MPARQIALALALVLALQLGAPGARGEPPAPGSHAPDFDLPGSDGARHRLADHRGQRGVVLAWFPKAFTPG